MNTSSSPFPCERACIIALIYGHGERERDTYLARQSAIDCLDDTGLSCTGGELVSVAGFARQHGLLNRRRLDLGGPFGERRQKGIVRTVPGVSTRYKAKASSDLRIQHRKRIIRTCFPVNVLILVVRHFSPLDFRALDGSVPRKTACDTFPQGEQILGERTEGSKATFAVGGEGRSRQVVHFIRRVELRNAS